MGNKKDCSAKGHSQEERACEGAHSPWLEKMFVVEFAAEAGW